MGSFHTSLAKQTGIDLFSNSHRKKQAQLIVEHDKELCILHVCVCEHSRHIDAFATFF